MPRRLGSVVLLSLIAVMVTAVAAQASGSSHGSDTNLTATLAIGDSVMLGAVSCLAGHDYVVDAAGNRRDSAVEALIGSLRHLPNTVVIHTGTNGGTDVKNLSAIRSAVGARRNVVFVTIQLPDDTKRYTFEDSTNAAIYTVAQRYPRTFVADWNALAEARPDLTGGDEIHLTNAGCHAYAALIKRAVRHALVATTDYVPMRQPLNGAT